MAGQGQFPPNMNEPAVLASRATQPSAELEGGRFLSEEYTKDSIRANFFQRIIEAVNSLAHKLGVSVHGDIDPPPPITYVSAKASNEMLHVALTHTPSKPVSRAINYFVEVDTNPSFPQPHVFHLGASRELLTPLPGLDDNGNPVKYYVRAYSQYPGSKPSAPTSFGGKPGAEGGSDISITMGGTTSMSLIPSTGSGTAGLNGQQGGFGFGKNPHSVAPNPRSFQNVESNANSVVATPLDLDHIKDGIVYNRTKAGGMHGGFISKVSQDGSSLFNAKGVGDAQTLGLDSEIADGSTYGRVKQSGLDGSGVVMQVGNSSGDYLKFGGSGTGSIYDSGGSLVAPGTKRHVPTTLYSQTNGGTANDGTTVYFNSGDGTPYLKDNNGNAFAHFANTPGIVLQAQNPPSGLASFYASDITPTSFKVVSKGSGSLTNYGITVNDGGGIINPTGGSDTVLDTSTDAYNTAASTSGGTTTQVQLSATINTILSETAGRPDFGGTYQFTAQVWSGDMGTLLASGTFALTVRSTGTAYSNSITLSGLNIAANSAFTCRIFQTSNSDSGAGSSSSAAFTGGYTSSVSVNGVDFIAHITEGWA